MLPLSKYRNGRFGSCPFSSLAIRRPTYRPCWIAACATPGTGRPSCTTDDASPTTNTAGISRHIHEWTDRYPAGAVGLGTEQLSRAAMARRLRSTAPSRSESCFHRRPRRRVVDLLHLDAGHDLDAELLEPSGGLLGQLSAKVGRIRLPPSTRMIALLPGQSAETAPQRDGRQMRHRCRQLDAGGARRRPGRTSSAARAHFRRRFRPPIRRRSKSSRGWSRRRSGS